MGRLFDVLLFEDEESADDEQGGIDNRVDDLGEESLVGDHQFSAFRFGITEGIERIKDSQNLVRGFQAIEQFCHRGEKSRAEIGDEDKNDHDRDARADAPEDAREEDGHEGDEGVSQNR